MARSITDHILEYGVTALIAKDDKIDQYDYSASITLTLATSPDTVSGYIVAAGLFTAETGTTGQILSPTGRLVFFDADPAIAAGDQNITAAESQTIVGVIPFASGNWYTESGGTAVAGIGYLRVADPIPFHDVSALYVAFYNTLATGFNDGADDDETMAVQLWYVRTD